MTKEEQYAQQLYQNLQQELNKKPFFLFQWLGINSNADLTISIEGSGYQWSCLVSKGNRQCSISCIHIDRNDTEYKGPEYYTQFKQQGKIIAEGRTFKKQLTLDAVKSFLKNKSIEELHEQFSFIDEEKRKLEKLRLALLETNTRETEVPKGQIITDYFSTSSLWFIRGKSTCRIYYHGYEPSPRYVFYWDDNTVFEISGSNTQRLSTLIFRWVVDREMPSILKKEFYEINLGPYASTYEEAFKPKGPIPEIKTLAHKMMVGKRIQTTAANPASTFELWRNFMPRLNEISNKKGNELYSLQIFDASLDFRNFSPVTTIFNKWAAVEVTSFEDIPSEMEPYELSGGLYAVFIHKGPASEGPRTFQYIYGTWIPSSEYILDNSRAHFGIMGEKYTNDDPNSEEELWIPIKNKF